MDTQPTTANRACFELGIKFGSLYHQFAGSPVSVESAASLERAMAESIENQPHCRSVSVDIDRDAVAEAADDRHGYTGLTGALYDCEIEVSVDDVIVRAALVDVDGYPEMQLQSVTERSGSS